MIQPNLFIFGSERSGTTLLCALLSEHSQVFALNESFIFHIYARSKGFRKLSNAWIYAVLSQLLHLPSAEYLVPAVEAKKYLAKLHDRYYLSDVGQTQENWLTQYLDYLDPSPILSKAEKGELTLIEMFNTVYSQLVPSAHKNKIIFGEKTPYHLYLSPWICSLYPQTKIVTIIRNPIANIAAIYKRFPGEDLQTAINLYLSYHDRRFNFLYEGNKSLVIRYEDLILSTEATLTNIYHYLNTETVKINREFNYYIKQGYVGNKIDVGRDLSLRQVFNEKQKLLIRDRCRPIFEKFYSEELD